MRKIILLLVIVTSLNYAQMFSGFGVKSGVTSSNTTFDLNNNLDNDPNVYNSNDRMIGFTFSFFSETEINSNIILIPTLQYSRKGFKLGSNFEKFKIGTNANTVKISTISFEILGKYKFNLGAIEPFLAFGPRVDYLMNIESDIYRNPAALGYNYWLEHNFNDFTFGVTLSVGLEYNFNSKNSLFIELAYKPDLTENYPTNKYFLQNAKINSVDLAIGFIF